MRSAKVEIDDASGSLSERQLSLLRRTLDSSLEETGRFLMRPDKPDCVFAVRLTRGTEPAARESWDISIELRETGTGRTIQAYLAAAHGPADSWLGGAVVKELAYRYAPPDNYPELAKRAGLAGRLEHPRVLVRDARVLLDMLMSDMEEGAWDKALGHADALVALQPAHSLAMHSRALALQRLGRLAEALDAAERHPEARTSSLSLSLKADILCDMERYEAGRECYEEALEIDPDYQDSSMKLRALGFFLESPPDKDLLFPRIGWCVNFLAIAPLVGGPDGRNRPNIEAAFEDMDAAFGELVGEGLSYYLEDRLLSAWRKAVRRGDPAAFDAACGPLVKGILRGAGHHFPGRAFRWLKWGFDLNWMQFGLSKHLQDMRDGEPPQASDVSAGFSELAAQMGGDELFARRCPAMAPVAARLLKAGQGAPTIEKLESACRGIDSFCEALFA